MSFQEFMMKTIYCFILVVVINILVVFEHDGINKSLRMTMPEVRHASVNSTYISVSLQRFVDPSTRPFISTQSTPCLAVGDYIDSLSFNLPLQLTSRTPSSRSSWSGLPVLPSSWECSPLSCWCDTGVWWPTCRLSGRHTPYNTEHPPERNPSSP